jgi:hypothetical protein
MRIEPRESVVAWRTTFRVFSLTHTDTSSPAGSPFSPKHFQCLNLTYPFPTGCATRGTDLSHHATGSFQECPVSDTKLPSPVRFFVSTGVRGARLILHDRSQLSMRRNAEKPLPSGTGRTMNGAPRPRPSGETPRCASHGLVENESVLSLQGAIFLRRLAPGSISLRKSWEREEGQMPAPRKYARVEKRRRTCSGACKGNGRVREFSTQ